MSRAYNDAKWQLGEPWASKLADFCAANYNAQAKEIVREALDEHIDRRLNEPELGKRYERFRRKRLEAEKGNNLKLIKRDED